MTNIPILVDAQWLRTNFQKPDIKIVDASSHLPTTGRNPRLEFKNCRIDGAVWFDINVISDTKSQLPHTLPSSKTFAENMQRLGLNDDDHIVVYCNSDLFSAARAWWMLRLFGHSRVSVLNGGLKSWLEIGGPTTDGSEPTVTRGKFAIRPSINAKAISFTDLERLVATDSTFQIADARSRGRFFGKEPEPRPGIRSGHIPKSCNIPISTLLENGKLKGNKSLAEAFHAGGIDIERPVITTCGSGVTACGLALALAVLGNHDTLVYDGSWCEWGGSTAPIE